MRRLDGARRSFRIPRVDEPNILALVLVVGVSPFATDTYIAALPAVRDDLGTSSAVAQLTMTAFLLGLAAGQLVCGPISDGVGRRRMLVGAAAAFAVLSAVCAVAPTAPLLVFARVLQGFAGGCGMAVGRAVVSDRYEGLDAATRYGTLMTISWLGPIVAPSVGWLILTTGDWRTVFGFLTALGVLMTLGALLGIPETLPAAARSPAGLAHAGRRMAGLLRRPRFRRVVVVQCLATAGFLTYIGGSSIVLQDDLGLSAGQYTLLFATNAAAMAGASLVFRLTVRRAGPRRLRTIGLFTSVSSTVVLAGYALVAQDGVLLAPVWALLAVMVGGLGLMIPATTAMAQEIGRDVGGTAAALQGGLVFGVGAVCTPLTGVLGLETVAGMACIMAVLFAGATGAYVIDERASRRDPGATPDPVPPLVTPTAPGPHVDR